MGTRIHWKSEDKAFLLIDIFGSFLYSDKEEFELAYRHQLPEKGYEVNLSELDFIPTTSIDLLTDLITYAQSNQRHIEFIFQKGFVWNVICLRGLDEVFKPKLRKTSNSSDLAD